MKKKDKMNVLAAISPFLLVIFLLIFVGILNLMSC